MSGGTSLTTLKVLALASWLAGCAAVGPDYVRPEIVLPAAFPEAGAADGSASTLRADWWASFGEPELSALVAKALERNTDLAQAVARVEQADGLLREAGGALLPEIDLAAGGNRARSSGTARGLPQGPGSTGNDLKFALSTSYELDFWGKARRGLEAAQAQYRASMAARDTVRLTVAGLTAQTWIGLRSLDEQLASTRETLKTRDEAVRIIDQRLRGGTSSRLELEQAIGLRYDSSLLLRELLRQRAIAQTTLGVLTAQPGLVLAVGSLSNSVVPPLPEAGVPSALLQRRPDIRRAEELLVSANAQIGVARAAMFPSISLTGSLGAESTALATLLEGPARIWSLGFGLTLPLFDGGKLAARTDQAGARQREASAAYQGAVASAFKEVADALAGLRAARESQADVEAHDRAAQNALVLTRMRYVAGYSGFFELVDAQRNATATALEVVRNRASQLSASVDVYRALGGGWLEPPPH